MWHVLNSQHRRNVRLPDATGTTMRVMIRHKKNAKNTQHRRNVRLPDATGTMMRVIQYQSQSNVRTLQTKEIVISIAVTGGKTPMVFTDATTRHPHAPTGRRRRNVLTPVATGIIIRAMTSLQRVVKSLIIRKIARLPDATGTTVHAMTEHQPAPTTTTRRNAKPPDATGMTTRAIQSTLSIC